VKFQIVKIF